MLAIWEILPDKSVDMHCKIRADMITRCIYQSYIYYSVAAIRLNPNQLLNKKSLNVIHIRFSKNIIQNSVEC